jgi:hypothetical protein
MEATKTSSIAPAGVTVSGFKVADGREEEGEDDKEEVEDEDDEVGTEEEDDVSPTGLLEAGLSVGLSVDAAGLFVTVTVLFVLPAPLATAEGLLVDSAGLVNDVFEEDDEEADDVDDVDVDDVDEEDVLMVGAFVGACAVASCVVAGT